MVEVDIINGEGRRQGDNHNQEIKEKREAKTYKLKAHKKQLY
jgi:hypothetical protein